MHKISNLKAKPADIHFSQVPVGFGRPQWEASAKVHVLIHVLRLEDQLHQKVFQKVQDDKNPFNSDKDIKAFFLANGVSEEKFQKAVRSFTAKTISKRNENLISEYSMRSVPSVIVNGRYKIEFNKHLDARRLASLINYLTTKDHAEQ
jgi:protein dithiol oxidoreductase (disulfide-forming)